MDRTDRRVTTDLGLLALRLTAGGLMAGHGAQKLFGVFGGQGPAGMAGWFGSIGLKPPTLWAYLAGASEFGSGLSLALGLGTPLGAVSLFGPMLMAWDKAHRGKPIWVASGGPEVPILFMAIATALGTAGPGRYSLDALFKIKTPTLLVAATAIGVGAGVGVGVLAQPQPESARPTPEEALAAEATGSGDAVPDGTD